MYDCCLFSHLFLSPCLCLVLPSVLSLSPISLSLQGRYPTTEPRFPQSSFSFSFSTRWHLSAWKGPYALHPAFQQSLQGCSRNSANICLVEHRLFSTLEGGLSAASFLNSLSFRRPKLLMLWPGYVQKVPQAPEHLSPVKLQTRCDICCAISG